MILQTEGIDPAATFPVKFPGSTEARLNCSEKKEIFCGCPAEKTAGFFRIRKPGQDSSAVLSGFIVQRQVSSPVQRLGL
jgi:hypothetical protein